MLSLNAPNSHHQLINLLYFHTSPSIPFIIIIPLYSPDSSLIHCLFIILPLSPSHETSCTVISLSSSVSQVII